MNKATDCYLVKDGERMIISVATSMLCACAAHGGDNLEYARGVLDTSRGHALALGRDWVAVESEIKKLLVGAGHKDFAEWLLSGQVLVSEDEMNEFLYPSS